MKFEQLQNKIALESADVSEMLYNKYGYRQQVFINEVNKRTKKRVDVKPIITEVCLESQEFKDLQDIATEANADYELALEAINNGKNYISNDKYQISLEGFSKLLNNKYKDLHVSTEDSSDDLYIGEPKGEGFVHNVKEIVKGIFRFFKNLFIAIKNRIMKLFGFAKKEQSDIKETISEVKDDSVNKAVDKAKDELKKNDDPKVKEAVEEKAKEDEVFREYVHNDIVRVKYRDKYIRFDTEDGSKEFSKLFKEHSDNIKVCMNVVSIQGDMCKNMNDYLATLLFNKQAMQEYDPSTYVNMFDEGMRQIGSAASLLKQKDNGERVISRISNIRLAHLIFDELKEFPSFQVYMEPNKDNTPDTFIDINRHEIPGLASTAEACLRSYTRLAESIEKQTKETERYLNKLQGFVNSIDYEALKENTAIVREIKRIQQFLADSNIALGAMGSFQKRVRDFIDMLLAAVSAKNVQMADKLTKTAESSPEVKDKIQESPVFKRKRRTFIQR